MARRKVASYVFADGVWYAPGDTVDAEAAKSITNPKAWATTEDEDDDVDLDPQPIRTPGAGAVSGPLGDPDDSVTAEAAAAEKAAAETESTPAVTDEDLIGEGDPEPDDSWKNADIWAYAKDHGIDLTGASKKADALAIINDQRS